MFKKLLTLAFILSSFYHAYSYNITIKIKGASQQKFFMGYYYGDKQYIKDSAVTDATGKMVFKGKEKLQGGIYLIASADKTLLFDFVVTEEDFSLETDTTDYNANMKIKGSPENTAFFAYSNFTTRIGLEIQPYDEALKKSKENNDTAAGREAREKMRMVEKKLTDYRDSVAKSNPKLLISKIFMMMKDVDIPETPTLPNGRKDSLFAYNYYRYHYFDHFDFTDDRISYTPVFHNKVEYYITKVTPQIPDSINKAIDYLVKQTFKAKETSKWCIYWITDHYERSQFMGMDAVFVHMVDEYYKDSTRTFWVDETLRYKIIDRRDNLFNNLIGKVAPNLNMPDTGFKMHALHDIKSKYTMMLFWDAHCGRCKEEIPKLKELYTKLEQRPYPKGKFFEVFAISMTPEADDWIKYVKENKLKWVNVSDLYNNTKYRKLYDIYSTPVIYLLDENKKIIAKRLSVEQVEDFIEKGIE